MARGGADPTSSAGSLLRELVQDLVQPSGGAAQEGDASLLGSEMGRYRIVSLLGKGGMGRVYEAEDTELGRRVAVKFLAAASKQRDAAEERFSRERSVTAELEHPGIVPIYDSGVWSNGQPFYVMRKVTGAPLDQLLARTSTLDERMALLGNLLAVADAVGFAHHHGIVHRDLKPSNILVAQFGETLVADWGLAKRVRSSEAFERVSLPSSPGPGETRTGAVLGTPAYMAPEQEKGADVDERADVYAIGVMLHELLRGRRPGASADGQASGTRRKGGASPAAGEEEENDKGMVDLAAIVHKALAPEPADRYANATELADELRRFQTGQLVGARRYTRGDLFRRWLRRYRAMLVLGATLGLVLLAVVVTSVLRIVRERDHADHARRDAEGARHEVAARNDALVLLQARALLEQDPTASLAWLKTYPETSSDWKSVSDIAADAWSRGVSRYVWRGEQPFVSRALAFSPDGALVAAGSREKGIHVWDVATGHLRWLESDIDLGGPVLFSPDGRSLVSSDGATSVRVWDLGTGARRAIGPMSAARLRFSPDGAVLLGAGISRGAHVLDVSSGSIRDLSVDKQAPASSALLPSEQKIATVVGDGLYLERYDGSDRQRVTTFPEAPRASAIDVSRDDARIAVGAAKVAFVFDRSANKLHLLRSIKYQTSNVRFAPDGRLVTFGGDLGLLVWNLDRDESKPATMPEDVRSFAESDSKMFFGGDNGGLYVFDSPDDTRKKLLGPKGPVTAVAVSLDGRWLASSSERTVRLWRLGEGEIRLFPGTTGPARLSRDGQHVLSTVNREWSVKLLDPLTGSSERLSPPRAEVWPASGAISTKGDKVLYSDRNQTVSLLDVPTRKSSPVLHYGPSTVLDLAEDISPDDRFGAVVTNDNVVHLVNLETLEHRVLGKHDGWPMAARFSPDGQTLATCGYDRVVKLWNLASATAEPRILRGHAGEVMDVRFLKDGKRLLSASTDGTIRLWNLDTGEALVFRGHVGTVTQADASADGKTLVSSGTDRTLRIWDVATQEGRVLRRTPEEVRMVSFAPDGKWIVWSDETTRISDPYATPALETDPVKLRAWMATETTAEVDAAGTLASRVP